MKSMRLYEQGGLRRYLLVMEGGDEACGELVRFARDRDIRTASLTAIGAASSVTLGYFVPELDDYEFTVHDEQVELASFVGDIAWDEKGPVLHAHGVLGRRDGSALAGHFREFHAFPTMEVMLIETPTRVRKAKDPQTGLELIAIEKSDAERATASDPSLPRGVGHIGVTVPDLEAATAFFRDGFGARVAYDGLTHADEPRRGPEVERQLGLPEGAAIVAQRMLQVGIGPGFEVFEIEAARHSSPAGLADYGWGHVALLVDDIAAVTARAAAAGATPLSEPHDNSRHEDTPGNASVYLLAPWGSIIELQALPSGHWYGSGSEVELWTPPRR
ncbi:PCC domain-containing protein [Microbacterium sp.]|uniref:PCC domain-containing protein n=1 Tax=Microbacterium sp. TaxID=51671 RepID=UPI003C76BCEB